MKLFKSHRRQQREDKSRRSTTSPSPWRRHRIEPLEDRNLLSVAPTLAPIPDQTVPEGAPIHIVLDGFDGDGDVLTYSVSATDSNLNATILEGNQSLRINVEDFGPMEFQLFQQRAPRPTDRIMELANSGFYDGVTFHRIIDNFMIQGGDPTGTGSGGPGSNFDDQFHPDLQHTTGGLLSMANSGDDTNGSQFFITETPTRHLDFNHSIFGFLTDGEDVREAISNVETDDNDRPLDPVIMSSVEVFTDIENGVLMLSAPIGATGEADVTVTVSDGTENGTAEYTFHVTITPDPNDAPPFLDNFDQINMTVNEPLTMTIPAIDVEGDSIQYEAYVQPSDAENRFQIVDNGDSGYSTTGPWNWTATSGRNGSHSTLTGAGDRWVLWEVDIERPGTYEVAITWSAWTNRSRNTPFYILDGADQNADVLKYTRINQQLAPADYQTADGTWWKVLDRVDATGDSIGVVMTNNAEPAKYVIADAVSVAPVNIEDDLAMEIDADTGVMTLTPRAGFMGVAEIFVRVRSETSDWDTQSIPVLVGPTGPSSVRLMAESDSGLSNSDGVTAQTQGLRFQVSGVKDGYKVTLMIDGVVRGTTIAKGSTAEIVTAAGFTLSEGNHAISAAQSSPDQVKIEIGNRDEWVDLLSGSVTTSVVVDTTDPQFTTSPILHATVGLPFVYNAGSDAEQSGAEYSLIAGPANAVFDSNTGALTWTADLDNGPDVVMTIGVTDAAGNQFEQTFTVHVEDWPAADVYDLPGLFMTGEFNYGMTMKEDGLVAFDATFIHADGNIDMTVWRYVDGQAPEQLGSSMTITDDEMVFLEVTQDDRLGVQLIGHNAAVDLAIYHVGVGSLPDAPTGVELLPSFDTGDSDSDRLTKINENLEFLVTGVAQGLEVTLLVDGVPRGIATAAGDTVEIVTDDGFVLSDGIHEISAHQAIADVEIQVGSVTKTVDLTGPASEAISIEVDTTAPTLTTAPTPLITVGRTFTYDIDSDEESLIATLYDLAAGPEEMQINPASGEVSWIADAVHGSLVTITVKATDAAGNFFEQDYEIVVNNWDAVDSFSLPDLDVDGSFFYGVTAVRDGYMMFDAMFAHEQGNVDMIVRDGNRQEIRQFTSEDDNESIVIQVDQDDKIEIELIGSNPDVTLEMAYLEAPATVKLYSDDDINHDSSPHDQFPQTVDGVTFYNENVWFDILGVTPGNRATLIIDGVIHASNIGTGDSVTLKMKDGVVLEDGVHSITATQTLLEPPDPLDPGSRIGREVLILSTGQLIRTQAVSPQSAPWEITIDTAPPEITNEPILHATIGLGYVYDANSDLEDAGLEAFYGLTVGPKTVDLQIDVDTGVLTWIPNPVDENDDVPIEILLKDLAGNSFTKTFHPQLNDWDTADSLDLGALPLTGGFHHGMTMEKDGIVAFDASFLHANGDIDMTVWRGADGLSPEEVASSKTLGDNEIVFVEVTAGERLSVELTGYNPAVDLDMYYTSLLSLPATPASVQLLTTSDTGDSDDDGLTKINENLEFEVTGVTQGLDVLLLVDGVVRGTATAQADTVVVVTDGGFVLSDGARQIEAVQRMPDVEVLPGQIMDVDSRASDAIEVTVDTAAPTITADPLHVVMVDQQLSFDVDSDEEDSGTALYEIVAGPAGLVIDPESGVVTWTAHVDDGSPIIMTVEVSDAAGNIAAQDYTIVVDDEVPVDSLSLPDLPIDESFFYTLTAASEATMTIDASFLHADGDIQMIVWSHDGTELGRSETDTDNESVTINVLAGDEIEIELTGSNPAVTLEVSGNAPAPVIRHPGDANGDGSTDLSDFNIWNANKFTSGTNRSTGDFNGDGNTDLSDFNIWNANKFTSAAPPAPAPVDAALALPAPPQAAAADDSIGELAGLLHLEGMRGGNDSASDTDPAQEAVDRLLASYWG